MRNAARNITPVEIEAAAQYYANQPVPGTAQALTRP